VQKGIIEVLGSRRRWDEKDDFNRNRNRGRGSGEEDAEKSCWGVGG